MCCLFYVPVDEHHQHEFPKTLPGGPLDQAAEAGLHHSHFALDLCTVFQGWKILPPPRGIIYFHLRTYFASSTLIFRRAVESVVLPRTEFHATV